MVITHIVYSMICIQEAQILTTWIREAGYVMQFGPEDASTEFTVKYLDATIIHFQFLIYLGCA